ncbi:MAG: phospholipid carrier-dependent glycosyltransferase [Ardenticatenales bacterium]|nr:phospholipid carrier-dependent glycosyltransferase [Ardenticatenales bacterium]
MFPTLTARYVRMLAALAVATFALALAPRLWRIDAHLTPDELRWVCRTVGFHTGIRTGDMELTLQTGHPGVITMWLGGLGLPVDPDAAWSKACLGSDSSELLYELAPADRQVILDRLYAGRRRIAWFTAVLAGLIVWLAGRLLGTRTALVAAPLVALDPFWLAHSRFLHLDGVLTGLMSVAVLTLLIFLVGDGRRLARRRWLVASGIALGMALAAKSPALFVVGFGGVLWLALARRRGTSLRTMIGEGVLWLAVAAATLVVVWPALWAEPLAVARLYLSELASHGTATLERASFFAGEVRDDAGPLFYGIVWWLRASPWVVGGVVGAGGGVGVGGRRATHASPLRGGGDHEGDGSAFGAGVATLVGFMVLFTVFLTAATKEFDRYLLPAFPAADIVAAAGWVGAVDWMRRWWAVRAVRRSEPRHDDRVGARHAVPSDGASIPSIADGIPVPVDADDTFREAGQRPIAVAGGWARHAVPLLAAIVLTTQLALVLPIGPYWVTWYDPLVGGAERAQRLVLVGWGEGLDQAAAFLNGQPGAAELEVASRYRAAFGLLFDGRNVQTDDYAPDTTDYLVVMLNQVQRHQDPELLAKYMGVDPPAFAAEIGGITLAWVYRNRADEGVAAFLDANGDPATDALVMRSRNILVRRYAGPLPIIKYGDATDDVHMARGVIDALGRLPRVWHVHRAEGERAPADARMTLLLETGAHRFEHHAVGDLVIDGYRDADPRALLPAVSRRLSVDFGTAGTLRLHGLALPDGPWPNDRQGALRFAWRAVGPIDPPATLSVQLLDATGAQRAQLDDRLVDDEGDGTDDWTPGVDVATRHALDVRGLPAGDYTLSIGTYTVSDGDWEALPTHRIEVAGLAAAGLAARVEGNRLLIPVRLADGAAMRAP